MSILDFGEIIFSEIEKIIACMQTKDLLAASKDCSNCNIAMVLSRRGDISDGYR